MNLPNSLGSTGQESLLVPDRDSQPRAARLQFVGHGSDYFPIWISNLLLTIITFGIYGPWAKVRREKFFAQHTRIEGTALDYHGDPIKILLGRVIAFIVLGMTYLQQFSIVLAMIGVALIAAIAPFALQRSMRFRLFNTSYRGLRFGFKGSVQEAYKILAIPAIVFAGLFLLSMTLMGEDPKSLSGWLLIAFFAPMLFYPVAHAYWRRYAINNAHYGSVDTKTTVSIAQFLGVYFSTSAMYALAIAVAVGLIYIGAGLVATFLIIPLYLAFLVMPSIVGARIQKLCWNRKTHLIDQTFNPQPELAQHTTQRAEFLCDLGVKSFVWLQIKNIFLTIVTFGLYRPYAAVNTAKARLESVTISDMRFVDDVVARNAEQKQAIGDEVIDVLDFDFAL